MSEPINVGDMVIIVRWPCCGAGLGKIYSVVDLSPSAGPLFVCGSCKKQMDTGQERDAQLTTKGWIHLSWLRRIPPLSELESTEHKEETHA